MKKEKTRRRIKKRRRLREYGRRQKKTRKVRQSQSDFKEVSRDFDLGVVTVREFLV